MKKIAIVFLFFVSFWQAYAQSEDSKISFTTGEFRAGYGRSIFGSGLRERFNAGNFSPSGGGLFTLSVYRKFKAINYFNFGLKFKALGAGPSTGDGGEEMFFNYWGSAATVKFFPFDKTARKGLYLQADYFFITQFTQKYRKTEASVFDHQFGIGNGVAFGIGYDFPLWKTGTALTLGLEYEIDSRRGEVSGIGDKTFRSSNIGLMVGVKF